MSFFLTFGATPTKATDSIAGFISKYNLSTSEVSDWTLGDGVSVSPTEIQHSGRKTPSFTGGKGSDTLVISCNAYSLPTVNFDVSTLSFKLALYVDDPAAIKDRNGKFLGGEIGFYGKKIYVTTPTEENTEENAEENAENSQGSVFASEDVFYKWDLSDVSLKQGWNSITLNFKTSETDLVNQAYTFEGINEFRLTLNKNTAASLTVAVDSANICIMSLESDGTVVEPITDKYTPKELAVATGVAALIVGGITATCFIIGKKEEKRRLEERKARIRAKKMQQNGTEK